MSQPRHLRSVSSEPETTADPGGGGGWGSDIEERLRHLEQQMVKVSTRLKYLPTKSDLEEVKTMIAEKESRMLKWMVGTMIAAVGSIALVLFKTLD